MNHHVLEIGNLGLAHATRTLATYLPGLSLGLVPLGPSRLLAPASTMQALAIEYGQAAVGPILTAAGVVGTQPVDDSGAIALLRARDTTLLPARAAPAPQVAGLDWQLAAVNAPQAWALLGGPDNIVWGGVSVGHIDTGYTEHEVFGFPGATWIQTALGATFFASSSDMDDPGPGGGLDPVAFSLDGHGTRTASVLCGHAPNAKGGAFYGVAPKVPLVPVRIANHVWINHAQNEFAQAVNHLVTQAGVGVISLSMGVFFSGILPSLRKAINQAYDAGVIVVCAAGNIVQDVVAPARLNRTLALGGVTPALVPWGGSSHGPEVDLSGPASRVRRAEMKRGHKPIYSGGGDGTSYATAMTAGAAALWLAHHGANLAALYPQPWQRVEAFKAVVCSTAQVPPGWQAGSFGSGVLDVHALLTAPLPAPATQPDAPA